MTDESILQCVALVRSAEDRVTADSAIDGFHWIAFELLPLQSESYLHTLKPRPFNKAQTIFGEALNDSCPP